MVSREMSVYLSSIEVHATAHQLRHWFATKAYRESRDIRVVQELLGHASPTTTAIYAAWSRDEAMRAVLAIEVDEGDPPTGIGMAEVS
jgi:integrase